MDISNYITHDSHGWVVETEDPKNHDEVVRPGQAVEFVYQGRRFTARVTNLQDSEGNYFLAGVSTV